MCVSLDQFQYLAAGMISEMSHLTQCGTHPQRTWRIRKREEQESKNIRETVLGSPRRGGGGGGEEARDRVRREIFSVTQADRSAVLKLKVQYR